MLGELLGQLGGLLLTAALASAKAPNVVVLLADDAEMYERTQMGVRMRNPEWLFLGRGKHRERRDADGFLIGDNTDEVPSRGIWRHYRATMEAA